MIIFLFQVRIVSVFLPERDSQIYFLQVWEVKNAHTNAIAVNKLNPGFPKQTSFKIMLTVCSEKQMPLTCFKFNLLINYDENAKVNGDNSKQETKD